MIIIIIILKTLLAMFVFLIMPKYSMICEMVKKVKKNRPLPHFNDKRKGTVGVTYSNVKYASAIHIPILNIQ